MFITLTRRCGGLCAGSWLAIAGVLALMAQFNRVYACHGQIYLGGWPFMYGYAANLFPNGNEWLYWSWTRMAANGGVAVLLALACALTNEFLHRHRLRVFQFSLPALLGAFFVIAVPFALFATWHHQYRFWRRQAELVTIGEGKFSFVPIAPQWLCNAGTNQDSWKFSFIPEEPFLKLCSLHIRAEQKEIWGALGDLTFLTELSIGQPATDTADLRNLPHLVSLSSLTLIGPGINDEDAGYISQLPHLNVLRLINTSITDRGAAELAKLRKLVKLDLEGTPITDGSLPAIASLPLLEELNLARTKVSGSGFLPLRNHPKLVALTLVNPAYPLPSQMFECVRLDGIPGLTQLSWPLPARIVSLSNLPQIQYLGASADTSGLHLCEIELHQLPSLYMLSFPGICLRQLTLRDLPTLRYLALGPPTDPLPGSRKSIDKYPVSDQTIREIVRCQTIEDLDLSGAQLSSAAWDQLAEFSARFLYLTGTNLTDGDLEEFKHLDSAVVLHLGRTKLSRVSFVDHPSLAELGLQDLSLEIVNLSGRTNLHSLHLDRSNATNDWLKDISNWKELVNLTAEETEVTLKAPVAR